MSETEIDRLLNELWAIGYECGEQGVGVDAVSAEAVHVKAAIRLLFLGNRSEPSARAVVIEQELIDLEQSIVECRTLTDFVTVQKTVLATRTAQSWEI